MQGLVARVNGNKESVQKLSADDLLILAQIAQTQCRTYVTVSQQHFQYQQVLRIFRKLQYAWVPVYRFVIFVGNLPYAHKGATLQPAVQIRAE